MSFFTASVLSVVGLVGLTLGADWLVRGASRLATHFGVSPLLVGLTVVAYGTSAPEITASLVAALEGYPEMTLGNVLGSNVANIGLILGCTAILAPLSVAASVLRRELPMMVAVTLLLGAFAKWTGLGRGVGVLFIALMLLFNYVSFRAARREVRDPSVDPEHRLLSSIAFTIVGLGFLLGGAQLLVAGAVSMARTMGLSDFIIGVTLVAVGTSLPELATSIVAGLRKEADLVVGAIVGSNTFNILGALGLSAILRPLEIDDKLLMFEFPALIAFTVAMAIFLFTGRKLVRREGVVLVSGYALFIALLFR